jgi:UDP-glucose 4-epimerase
VAVTGDLVLVSGGAGFIGVNLARLLRRKGFGARCLDDFSTGRRSDAEAAGYEEIVQGDVRDLATFRAAAQGCRYVVHLAAQAGVPASVLDPLGDADLNVRGTLHALVAARDAHVDGMVFASSLATLGEIDTTAHEGLLPHPRSPYGASKLAGEAYCAAFAASYDLPTVALRFSNVYGPFSYHKGSVIAAFCKAALAGEPVVIYGDGRQTRDFVHVEDICAGIVRAMTSGVRGRVAHLASGEVTSVLEVAEAVAGRFGGEVAVEHRPARPGDVQRSSTDIGAAAALFGYEPQVGLEDGIDRTVAWFSRSAGA